MKVQIVKDKDCEVTLNIEIPKDRVITETELVYKDIQARTVLPGFRAGKAPMEMVRKNFEDRARKQILDNLVGHSISEALKDKKIPFVSWPRVEKLDFHFDRPLTMTVKVEREPEFKLKGYKGIKVTRRIHSVAEKQIEEATHQLLEEHATLVDSVTEIVSRDHFAVIDYAGSLDGQLIAQTRGENQLLNMAAPQTISGFAEGILGAKKGETRQVPVTFPTEYPEKTVAGKLVSFEITVKEIKEKKRPVLDDEFAKDLGAESAAKLRESIEKNLRDAALRKTDRELEDQMLEGLLENHPFPVPVSLVEERTHHLIEKMKNSMQRQGLPAPQEADSAAWKERFQPQATREVRLSFVLRAIAKEEKLEAGDKELAEMKAKAMAEEGTTDEQKQWIEKYFTDNREKILPSITEEHVMKFLKDNAKIKEEAAKA